MPKMLKGNYAQQHFQRFSRDFSQSNRRKMDTTKVPETVTMGGGLMEPSKRAKINRILKEIKGILKEINRILGKSKEIKGIFEELKGNQRNP